MFTMHEIRDEYGRYICRQCMMHKYRVELNHEDCHYGRTDICPRCQQKAHIVVGLTLSGRLKMIGSELND